jgi:hypothetical protein
LRVANGGASQADFTSLGTLTTNATARISATYKAADFALSTNGNTVATLSSGTVPSSLTQLTLGIEPTGACINAPIRRLTYWPTRLPNSTLQAITQ